MNSPNTNIALGLSGGVDSAVSAYLLKKQGISVTAFYIKCWNMPGCRAEQDRQDALKLAIQLGIPFQVLDFKEQYKNKVMAYFLNEYQAGHTPNPDVLCNQEIKFGLFYDWAINNGFSHIATGHYAQTDKIIFKNQEIPILFSSQDLHKDQTYFLNQIKQEQLPHILFPIGHLLKTEVRQLARNLNLPVADKKDSVGICFVGDINVHNFLKENLGEKTGDIVTQKDEKIGEHQGIWFYTIGQRHGFNLNVKLVKKYTNWLDEQGNIPPLYVIQKNSQTNKLMIGPKINTLSNQFSISSIHWINQDLNLAETQIKVRIRHTGKLVNCEITTKNNKLMIKTQESLQGLATGQFAVFYTQAQQFSPSIQTQYICLGGGVIE